jgi:hypothetical protein
LAETTDTVTVSDLLDEWYAWKRRDFSPTTRATTEGAIAILKRDFGDHPLDALRPRHIDRWGAQMTDSGYSDAYVKRLAGVLSAASTCGVRWELCTGNPVVLAQLPKVGRTKVRPPTSDVVKAALEYARSASPHLLIPPDRRDHRRPAI